MAEDIRAVASTDGISEFDRGYQVPHCVVLDSAYCSMGRMIAVRACKAVGWAYHDSVTLLELVPELGVSAEDVEAFERRATSDGADLIALRDDEEFKRIKAAFDLATTRALAEGPCLIHDRASKAVVESLGYRCVSAMTYAADAPAKRVRACISPLFEHLTSPAEIDAGIARQDNYRRTWHALTDDSTRWGEPTAYDLMINTDLIGRDFAAELLAHLMGA